MSVKRAIRPEDLFELKAVSDPQISPDGSTIAFVETTMDRDTNRYVSRIRILSASGDGEPKRATSGPGLDYAPRWSPDGSFLAFLSTRSGEPQIWIMPASGGDAELLSDLRDVASAPVWSPDGRSVACIVEVGSDEKDVLVIDRLRYKLDSVGFLVDRNWHVFIVQAQGPGRGEYRQMTFGQDYNFSSPAWSPDGRFLAAAGNRLPARTEIDLINEIWVIPATGGTPRRLTRSTGPADHPLWSPDGRFVAYLGHNQRSGYYSNRGIWIVPVSGGEPMELTAGFRYPVGDYAIKDFLGYGQPAAVPHWSRDGRHLYMSVSAHGAVHLWRFSVSDGRAVPLTRGTYVIYNYSFSSDDGRVAFAVTAPTLPNDIWIGDIRGGRIQERRLTRINQEWLDRTVAVQPVRFTFRSPGGPREEGWIHYPPQIRPTDKVPAVLEIHGGPTVMYGYVFFFEFQLLATNGIAVISSNPRGSMGYGEEFAAAIGGDWGNLDYRDLMSAVDAAVSRGMLDPDRIGVAGGSYGGYMTNWIVTQNHRFKAAVSMRGISNLYSFFGTSDGGYLHVDDFGAPPWQIPQTYLRQSPITYVANVRTPLLLIHSDRDFRVPIEQGEQFYTALKFLGRDVRMLRFLTETHELSREGKPRHRVIRLEQILHWFQRRLNHS
ncbi:S9 family peptidase [Cohnella pontilimi]|uniref:S9 family peptidase n=1 Tax=Cohnella pontilimi TaxID=2564100 RepID=A0A4U0FCS2_9BACL|nr:S9 family peptidase [Cohnella pontilimi]TJY42595.1 S9 family peptidase [Cohnella pontilimi]